MPTAPKQFRFGPSKRQARTHKGTTAERGYGARWQKFREWYFSFWFNAACGCGCGNPAQELDHVERVSGRNDEKFYDAACVIGLSLSCHSRKTALVDYGMGNAPTKEGSELLNKLKAEAARRAELMRESEGWYA